MKLGNVPAKVSLLALIGTLSLGLIACGNKSKFAKQEFKDTATADLYTKPKIDIVVFQDNSASMVAPMTIVKNQFNGFVNDLDSRWDYHLVVLPLQKLGNLNYYPVTSKYILASDCSTINTAYCLNASQKGAFNSNATDAGWMTSTNVNIGSEDVSFSAMTANLNQAEFLSSGFLRGDAALAIVVITNGEDISIWNGASYASGAVTPNFYVDPDGDGTSEINYSLASFGSAASQFENFLTNYKAGTGTNTRFYAVASANRSSNCYGSPSFQGRRYIDLSLSIGGAWFDFCNQSALGSVMSGIRYDLDSLIQSYVFDHVVLDADPVVSSIKIYKNGVEIKPISQDPVNGYTYEGYQTNQPTVIWPSPLNNRTGYFIKMNGSSTFQGTDQIEVTYQRK